MGNGKENILNSKHFKLIFQKKKIYKTLKPKHYPNIISEIQ